MYLCSYLCKVTYRTCNPLQQHCFFQKFSISHFSSIYIFSRNVTSHKFEDQLHSNNTIVTLRGVFNNGKVQGFKEHLVSWKVNMITPCIYDTYANTLPHCLNFMCVITCAHWPLWANRQCVMWLKYYNPPQFFSRFAYLNFRESKCF
jgi:hypothetical protein